MYLKFKTRWSLWPFSISCLVFSSITVSQASLLQPWEQALCSVAVIRSHPSRVFPLAIACFHLILFSNKLCLASTPQSALSELVWWRLHDWEAMGGQSKILVTRPGSTSNCIFKSLIQQEVLIQDGWFPGKGWDFRSDSYFSSFILCFSERSLGETC